jgi:peroxiredoxin
MNLRRRENMDKRSFLKAGVAAAFLAGSALIVGTAGATSGGPLVGAPAPNFTAKDSNGKTVSLADFKGKTVVLEWTNNGCPFVRKHYGSGNMQKLQDEATKNGVVWLSIASSPPGMQGHVDGPAANAEVVRAGAKPTAVVLDHNSVVAKTYQARVTPHMYIVDPKGTLVYMGGIDDKPTANPADIPGAKNYVREALGELKAGKPISAPNTRAYGCTVHYAS